MPRYRPIPLTKGQTALVDEADHDVIVAVGRWCFSNSGYAVHYFKDEYGKRGTLYMHRLIMQRVSGIPPGLQVDHINQTRVDNRRVNLRLATRSQNQAHKGRQINNTSLQKGVTFNSGRWEARIRFQGKRINLGRFTDPLQAAMMYDAASRFLYQDFAGCNFPEKPTPTYIETQLQMVLNKRG
jgi:hypothetical protein